MMVFTLAARELRSLFLSPPAWAILAVTQIIMAYLFLIQLERFALLQPQLAAVEGAPGFTTLIIAPLLDTTGFVLMLIVPLLTMRLLSEERRSQTLCLLFSAPLSMSEIVIGKYLGVMAYLLIMILMLLLMPLSLQAGGSPDYGTFAAGVLGLVLLVGCFAAVGLFISSLTAQPVVAAIGTFGALLLLRILDWAGSTARSEEYSGLFSYLSILRHFESLLLGVFNSSDVAYYLLFIATFIVLTIRRLDAYRLQH
jgi:ABC-2 type transport system permease protein